MKNLFIYLVLSLGITSNAHAIPLTVNDGFTVFATDPSLNGISSSSFEFTLAGAGVLTIVDMCHGGDAYDVLNFSSSIGSTSTAGSFTASCLFGVADVPTVLADSRWDVGIFNLSPGSYSISTKTIIDGGAGANRGGISVTSAVPEPITLALMSLGLLGLGITRRNRA